MELVGPPPYKLELTPLQEGKKFLHSCINHKCTAHLMTGLVRSSICGLGTAFWDASLTPPVRVPRALAEEEEE